jgi:formylglycine-generating enzyme
MVKKTTMKHLTLITLFLAFGMLTFGQTGDFDIIATQKTLAKINDSLYASKFEVTNKQYITFLNFLKQSNQADKYLTAQIDTAQWRDELTYNEPYAQYYHTHPAYMNYPVVNISYEGATLFCEWLTDQYNSNDKRKFKKVKFRLPSELQWTTAAKGGNSTANYPWKGTDLQTKKGLYRCNFRRATEVGMGVVGKLNDNADVTAPSQSYWPNKYGLYNMSGNVAEMLIEKGQTKGGSWQDIAEAMKIENNGKYASFDTPMPSIGFRHFMDVIEN